MLIDLSAINQPKSASISETKNLSKGKTFHFSTSKNKEILSIHLQTILYNAGLILRHRQ